MTQLQFKPLNSIIKYYDLILLDIWGVIFENGEVYYGVIDIIKDIMRQKKVMFLTNSSNTRSSITENLYHWGIDKVTENMVVTSGHIARKIINDNRAKNSKDIPTIFHLGKERNDDILTGLNYKLTDDLDKANILLLTLYRDDNENINELDEILKQAATKENLLILCANPDITIPTHGEIRYCSGYFAKKIEKFGGKVTYTGKPQTIIYNYILDKNKHIEKNRILMVGDTLETDIIGANKCGIHSALTLSGNAMKFHYMHESMDNKLLSLQKVATKIEAIPTFVTKLI